MKQLPLGVLVPAPSDCPEVGKPEGLPEFFPDSLDDLRPIAATFCRAFANCKSAAAVRKNSPDYIQTLVSFRRQGIPAAVAWQALADARMVQDDRPLFGAQSKKAFAFLPARKPVASKPRTDSCGCALPDGVYLPKMLPSDRVHWDGEGWIWGNDCDPGGPCHE